MTAADKLRELLGTRPRIPSDGELYRWWTVTAELVPALLADMDALDCDLIAERAEHRRVMDERASLRRELDREKMLHRDTQFQVVDRGMSYKAMTAERDAYRAMLCDVIASAHPNERDHPAMSKQWARARELLKNGPPPVDDENRCAVCGWPLEQEVARGCVRGNCSLRPRPEHLYAPERAAKETAGG